MKSKTSPGEIGKRIAENRIKCGLSVHALAAKARPCSDGHLHRVESGAKTGSLKLLGRIADALGVPLTVLLDGETLGEKPSWAQPLEEVFDHSFSIVGIEHIVPDVKCDDLSALYVLPDKARQVEKERRLERRPTSRWIGLVTNVDDPKRNANGALVYEYEVGSWDDLTAMREANLPCYALYAGAILTTEDGDIIINRRARNVNNIRTYSDLLASYGGTFIVPRKPDDPTRRPDVNLLATARREIMEESATHAKVDWKRDILVLMEQDRKSPKGAQYSVHVIFMNAVLSVEETENLRTTPEGSPERVSFDDLKGWLLGDHAQWAPCGLAHYMVWLRQGAPGLNKGFQRRARQLYEEVLQTMHERGSWQKKKS